MNTFFLSLIMISGIIVSLGKKSLLILILLTIPYTTALSMQQDKQSEQQEAEQVAQPLRVFQIGDNWNETYKGLRLKLIAYQLLAHTRKIQLNRITHEKQTALAELNQEQISHEQTRNALHTQHKIFTKELNQRKEKIDELHSVVEQLTNINEQLVQRQEDYGH